MNRALTALAVILIVTARPLGAENSQNADSPSSSGVSAAEFAALRADFERLARRFERLAAENAALRQSQPAALPDSAPKTGASAGDWTENIRVKGDFRYRYQNDDVDLAGRSDRNRQRIRARPAIVAQLPPRTEIGFGLATGSDSPVSANQTLGGGGSSKAINLDLAYFKWEAVDGLHVVGGKFKNEFHRSGGNGLLWDSDWRPEGFQLLFDKGIFFANGLANWIAADGSSGSGESFVWGLQGGVDIAVAGGDLKMGLSYFDIPARGEACFFEASNCFGNSIDAGGNYLYDFEIANGFAEFAFRLWDVRSLLFVDYVTNEAARREDTGYALGLRLGEAESRGRWEAAYVYQDLEANAVLGLLTDSNFGGGGTDARGHKLSAAYAVTEAASFRVTYLMAERQDSNGLLNGGRPFDVDTLQLDLSWAYR